MAGAAKSRDHGMSLPPLAPIPPHFIRRSLAPEEWQACMDAWITLAELDLRLPPTQFKSNHLEALGIPTFLQSLYSTLTSLDRHDHTFSGPAAKQLQKTTFMLTRRLILEIGLLQGLGWPFMSNFCHVHIKSNALVQFLGAVWKQKRSEISTVLQTVRKSLTQLLESASPGTAEEDLARLASVIRASPDAGAFFMTGSDFVEALTTAYEKLLSAKQRRMVSGVAYLGLTALTNTEDPNLSALSDHLYSLKAHADGKHGEPSLLADIVTNTPLVSKLRRQINGGKSAERLSKLLDTLDTYRMPSIARPRSHRRPNVSKGKGKQTAATDDLHIHRMSLVTQIQDLFPELGAGFILRLLDEYGDDVEQATAHLLEDSLPPHLRSLDRSESAPSASTINEEQQEQQRIDHLAPRSTPPFQPFIPSRHNAFDSDDLADLASDTSRLHIGKRDRSLQPPTDPNSNKAAILSALAAFDSDDDERDDTYDVEDVGGMIDTAHPDGEPGPSAKVTQEENEMALFTAYKATPELFGRTFNIRRGQARMALKAETGMTDEAIEGWAIMLAREPKRLQRLEAKAGAGAAFDGRQVALGSTAYREGTETEDSDVGAGGGGGGGGPPRGGGRGRGRGRGRGGRGGGGSVAGPSGEKSTEQAQRRKEASKGSRANHNRQDQRAKKMARGGFPG